MLGVVWVYNPTWKSDGTTNAESGDSEGADRSEIDEQLRQDKKLLNTSRSARPGGGAAFSHFLHSHIFNEF